MMYTFKKPFLTHPLRLFFWIFLLCSQQLRSDDTSSDNILRFAVDNFPPWVIVTEKQHFQGIDIRIARRIAADLEMQPEFLLCPFARCLKMMEVGKADMMLNLFRSEDRESYIAFIEPHININPAKVFYLRKDDPRDILSYDDLNPLLTGYVRETQYFRRFDMDTSLNKLALGSDQQLLEMLLKGRIDTFIATDNVIDYWAKQAGYTDFIKKASFNYQAKRLTYAGLSRKSPQFARLKEYEATIRFLRSEKQIANIIDGFWQEQQSPR